jgi:hypothetical protein
MIKTDAREGQAGRLGHRQTNGSATDAFGPTATAPHSDSTVTGPCCRAAQKLTYVEVGTRSR